jgi:DNA-binding NtrC family response regulator
MLAGHERCIDWAHLPDDISEDLLANPQAEPLRAATPSARPAPPAPGGNGAAHNLEQHARLLVQQALEQSGGNVSQAARALGISRQTLYKKLKAP